MNKAPVPQINLTDPTLFGNDAAEDEDQAVFDSYFLQRSEVDNFAEQVHKLRILRGHRGEGKSAILRKVLVSLQAGDTIVTHTTGSSLAPPVSSLALDQWTQGWKRSIFDLLASEIGSRIGMAWGDDAISLVEEAEKKGFRKRSVVSSVVDRLKASNVPERQVLGSVNSEKLVQRWMREKPLLWVFVDDVDEGFENRPESKVRVASFFTACRQITNLVPEIRIRAGIRPNIWALLRPEPVAESLSKVDQYVLDLRWDIPQMRSLLAKRIEGYIVRSGQSDSLRAICNLAESEREETLIAYAFENQMPWGRKRGERQPMRPPHVPMATLSRGRPRWMIELARVAARHASETSHSRITLDDITDPLTDFGQTRIHDTSVEYSPQCSQVLDVINAFADQYTHYSTAELCETITRRVLPSVPVRIGGRGDNVQAMDVAAFLYEIGFITAEEKLAGGEYRQYAFDERPSLLHNKANPDQGMSWEIHPVFRQALRLNKRDGDDRRKRGSR
jgi:hypothetical protein